MFRIFWRHVSLALLFTLFGTAVFGQNAVQGLLDKEVAIEANDRTFISILGTLGGDFDIPMGFILSSSPDDPPKVSLTLKKTSLRNALDRILELDPNYQWEFVDGVINISPKEKESSFLSELLDLKIAQVNLSDRPDLLSYEVKREILKLPEVSALMISNGIRMASFVYETPDRRNIFTKDITERNYSNMTFRQLLNKIIVTSHTTSWSIKIVGKEKDQVFLSL